MGKNKRYVKILLATCMLMMRVIMSVGFTHAQSSTTTIGVGDTIIRFQGWTLPNALVHIEESAVTIGTITTLSDGTYSQDFLAQTPGIRTFSIWAEIIPGDSTDAVSITANINEHGTTVISTFLPPSLQVTADGETPNLQLKGYGTPGSTIMVFIDGQQSASVTPDTNGYWEYVVATDALSYGQHSLFVKASLPGGNLSFESRVWQFMLEFPADPSEIPSTDRRVRVVNPEGGQVPSGSIKLSDTPSDLGIVGLTIDFVGRIFSVSPPMLLYILFALLILFVLVRILIRIKT